MRRTLAKLDPLERYSAASERAAGRIIAAYSTSFGLATRLLGARHRSHVRNVYALVRVADELVDGVASEARVAADAQRSMLDELEGEVAQALLTGYSSNPIVHAFGRTARAAGIDASLTGPFFASMRTDLADATESAADANGIVGLRAFDADAHAAYVYGSAEVVGLMCLRIFMRDEQASPERMARLEHGARRLGAAFQNINFLRDLADDTDRLGRSYLSVDAAMTPERQSEWITTIRAQLADAEAVLPELPRDARVAVGCAYRLFARLAAQLAETPTAELRTRRVRVADPMKAVLLMQSALDLRKADRA